MSNIYMLTDAEILKRIASKIKGTRLRQNLSQQALAEEAGVSLSSVIRVENGEIKSFDTLLRILRTLGKLEVFAPLIEEEQLSPSEYFRLVNAEGGTNRKRNETKTPARKRAAKATNNKVQEDVEW